MAGGQRAVGRAEIGEVGIPASRQLPVHGGLPLIGQLGVLGGISLKASLPLGFPGPASLHRLSETGQNLVGNVEGGLSGPSQVLLGASHLFLAQWCTVGLCCILLARAAVGDVGADHDQRWLLRCRLGGLDSGRDGCQVIAVVHSLHVPTVGLEATLHILGEGQIGAAFDGNVVVVVEVDQLTQAQVPGQ